MSYIWTNKREFEYNPGMDVDDFVRNNELTDREMEDIERIKETMKMLYSNRIDENF